MHVLVAYATTDGMTAQIAERIGQTMRTAGATADVLDTAHLPDDFDPERYDAILAGASLHAQGFQRAARRFVERYRGALRTRPSGFFSVCLAIMSNRPQEREAARRLAAEFPAQLAWTPDAIEVIAGALMFSRYGFLRRTAMKRIARHEMGSVDATRDTVFTNWAEVDRFAIDFVELATQRAGRGAPRPTQPPAGAPVTM